VASLELRASRRGFLAALAGMGALGCHGRSPRTIRGAIVGGAHGRGHLVRDGRPPAPEGTERKGVAILGDGITGLSAAWALERAGFDDFVVLELEDDPGGTARSGSGPVCPYPWAAHYVPAPGAENRPLVALLEEMGVVTGRDAAGRPSFAEDVLVREPQERLFYRGEWFEGLYPVVGASPRDLRQIEELEREMERWARWRDAEGRRAFAVPRARGSSDPEVSRLDALSMAEWLDQHGWDSPRLRWYVGYACRDDFGATLEQTSAWAGVHYFSARAEDESGDVGEFLTWPEGNGRLVDHLAGVAGDRLRRGTIVADVVPGGDGVRVVYVDAASGRARAVDADRVVFALPRFLARHLLEPYRSAPPAHLAASVYGSWMVANLTLRDRPAGRGFEPAWDNVLYDSPSLGYVTATHQMGSDHGPTVLTYYLPLLDDDPVAARTRLLETSWEQWAAGVVGDLSQAHPDLESLVEQLDVYLWGHAMIRPRPGLMCGPELADSALPHGRVHFAHTDLSGMALFEEAQYWGIRAAENVMRERRHRFESWL